MQLLERNWESQDWITILVVSCLLIVAVTHFLYPRRFREFLMLPITDTYFYVRGKDGGIMHPFNLLLLLVQLVSVALFLFFAADLYPDFDGSSDSMTFLMLLTGYTLFISFKFAAETLVGKALHIESVIEQYLYRKLTYRNLIGLVLMVATVLFAYTVQPSQIVILSLLGLVLVVNLLTLFYAYKSMSGLILRNFFYFILYLCALEISPYVILYYILM